MSRSKGKEVWGRLEETGRNVVPFQFFVGEDDLRFHGGSRHSRTISDLACVRMHLINWADVGDDRG